MKGNSTQVLKDILSAEHIAVVGASNKQEKWGYKILKNLIKAGYQGGLYAVNSRESNVLGVPAYPSVTDIPGPVDLLVVVVPAQAVPEVLRQGREKKARGAVILTSGFREAGNTALEEELQQVIKQGDLRVIGPNIQGINSTYSNLCIMPAPFLTRRGPIGIVSQSGSVSATIGEWAETEGVGFSNMINLGNQADLCEADFLEYMAEDTDTRVIALYLEGPKDGKRFGEALKRTALRKPVVILKPGRTEGGSRAAASHTASIAGDDKIFSYACRQYGVTRASEMESFYDVVKALGMQSLPKGNRVGVATTSGGTISLFIDEAESKGLQIVSMPAETVEELKGSTILSSGGINIGNYCDIPGFEKDKWQAALEIMARYDYADMYLFVIADPVPGVEHVIIEYAEKVKVPVVVAYMGGGEAEKEGRQTMQKAGIPVYPTPERAARALAALAEYGRYRREQAND